METKSRPSGGSAETADGSWMAWTGHRPGRHRDRRAADQRLRTGHGARLRKLRGDVKWRSTWIGLAAVTYRPEENTRVLGTFFSPVAASKSTSRSPPFTTWVLWWCGVVTSIFRRGAPRSGREGRRALRPWRSMTRALEPERGSNRRVVQPGHTRPPRLPVKARKKPEHRHGLNEMADQERTTTSGVKRGTGRERADWFRLLDR
jgi:hypothetical protein